MARSSSPEPPPAPGAPSSTPATPTPTTTPRSRGRRGGGEDVRAQIVDAARAEFLAGGYAGASIRAVARGAGVDPALVRYYFPGGKPELFAASMARRVVDPARLVEAELGAGLDGLGERLLDRILGLWDAPGGRDHFRTLFAATASGQDTLLRDFLMAEVFGRLRTALPGPDVELRLGLLVSQAAGVLVARYVLEVDAIASAPRHQLVAAVGPTLQRYLTGEIPQPRSLAPEAEEEHYSSHGE